jgi:hypothetical protein
VKTGQPVGALRYRRRYAVGLVDNRQPVCANAQTEDFNRDNNSLHQALEPSRVRAPVRAWNDLLMSCCYPTVSTDYGA